MSVDYRLVVILDRDNDDCSELARCIDNVYGKVGLRSRSDNPAEWQVATCVAIEELEAWYFGDWDAVRNTYPKASATVLKQARYRNPDDITGGTWEAFERVMQRSGYFT